MKDKVYSHLKERYDEVYSLSPNNLGFTHLTQIFKTISGQLKFFPFKIFIPLSLFITVILYLVFGIFIVRLVSLLQHGF
ncbi:hypothetical protein A3H80_02020 [Candidatus Roizmanbacteria bacterium RIFCSPLOWO2_02_FULL_37_19]|uniref:Uncharacterized protein n=1 Tax=Candidatus Roizmanbacteria bacterium RIFCSPHIGHO2_02_FULL_37_24 TaxID=1802037 RepID=A0A1F7GZV3_9BACT|nr:MAG: hypothetical protein A2862_02605 [Candidatus Roizmanbacteria bacterium RIFCSPHIGHO2_01_FULL_38_41]OGK24511.1 MAG: hypothetical protein A3C24_03100 [Candidatus Roizmanbacteria bacterium RIFCSPHIGHO2_02_FULL_37_24]OGK31965.1 MAG: hypothetical protein A3E10_04440 [Candidatus Roizmanbacteria bacterium RIFCSPHIGHO2_12_FULL_37_23]OGK54320.1 MAG: hypothetical protein A3H80_02020 [Candidatus Roizmanbacteria bacterium RIFCSPLOWO2_02_FULL_37_19]